MKRMSILFIEDGIDLYVSSCNINGEIELYSSRSLQNSGFKALELIALEKQSLTENLTQNLQVRKS